MANIGYYFKVNSGAGTTHIISSWMGMTPNRSREGQDCLAYEPHNSNISQMHRKHDSNTHTRSLSLTHFYSLCIKASTHTHCLSIQNKHIHKHTRFLSLTLCFKYDIHTLCVSIPSPSRLLYASKMANTHILPLSLSLSHTLTFCFKHSLSLSLYDVFVFMTENAYRHFIIIMLWLAFGMIPKSDSFNKILSWNFIKFSSKQFSLWLNVHILYRWSNFIQFLPLSIKKTYLKKEKNKEYIIKHIIHDYKHETS